ncbi:MAG: cellulose biosynthesis cyclic di-GMP-binding regulatory protein BcsB [Terrimicrobiaceae bacterium]
MKTIPSTLSRQASLFLILTVFAGTCLAANPAGAIPGGSAPGQPSQARRHFVSPLFLADKDLLSGVLAHKDYMIRLPEHLRYEAGSELILHFKSSPLLLADVSTMTVGFNDRPMVSVRLGGAEQEEASDAAGRTTLTIPIPAGSLNPGWNRVSVKCLLQTTQVPCRDVDNPAAWVEMGEGSLLKVAYADQALFPEMQRFPESLTEPQLMQMNQQLLSNKSKDGDPTVSILIPGKAGDAELRAFLISTARMAQNLYMRDESFSVGDLKGFSDEATLRNGILIGTKADLAGIDLPAEMAASLRAVKEGEGFLAEFVTGNPGKSLHRWMILSGGDSAGLENAALALGSSASMEMVPGNPWIVSETPVVPPVFEKIAQPRNGEVTLASLPGGAITLRGLFRNEASRRVEIPVGTQTVEGGFINLDFSHAENLDKTSAFDVKLNDLLIGSVALNEANSNLATKQIAIPAGLPGRDPSIISISSYLDIGTVDCGHRNEERAWVNISGMSTVDIQSGPLKIEDLSRMDFLLLRDALLRKAAVILPSAATPERMETLKSLAVFLGHRLPSSPVLWPQVATYDQSKQPDKDRVANRSGLILGSAFEWPQALPGKPALVISSSEEKPGMLQMRGQWFSANAFDQSLSFAQLLPSPWSRGELFAAVGGIGGYGGKSTTAMLTDPLVAERLGGTVAAVDARNRVVTYDVRFVQGSSLGEQITEGLPPGLTLKETEKKKESSIEAGAGTIRQNVVILIASAVILLVIFTLQRFAARRRRDDQDGRKL